MYLASKKRFFIVHSNSIAVVDIRGKLASRKGHMHQTRDRNTKAGSGLSTIEDGRFSIVHQTDISTGLSRLLDRQSWQRKRAQERQSESARREIRPLKIAARLAVDVTPASCPTEFEFNE